MMKITKCLTLTLVISLSLVGTGFGQIVHWVDWQSASTGDYSWANGVITLADSSTVNVSFTGDITFANTNGGSNYWNYPGTYTNAFVENLPPCSDIIATDGGANHDYKFTFSKPLTNPIFAIVSMGRYSGPVNYYFDAPFDIISEGQGAYGNGSLTELDGNVLEGKEGHGMIQFKGTFESIAWSSPVYEYWHGFTIAAIPEPATLTLLVFGAVTVICRKKI